MISSHHAYNHRKDIEKAVGYSQAVLAGGFLFISGCVSWDNAGNPLHAGDIGAQVETVYADIDATLKANGMDAGNIVKETLFTTDMAGLSAVNDRRMAYYEGFTPPASTWIGTTQLVHPDLLLEIEITAYKGA